MELLNNISQWLLDIVPGVKVNRTFKEGRYYYYSHSDYEKAFKIWQPLAEDKELAEAYYNIAVMYKLGRGVQKNDNFAKDNFELAAKMGMANAMHNHAVILEEIDGNYTEAFQFYKKAAKANLKEAQCRLGVLYQEGRGTDRDYKKAMKWFKKSAANGCAEAKYRIGEMHYRGEGREKNLKEARKCFLQAANKGNQNAQFKIAWMNSRAEGGDANYQVAIDWYIKAAEQGEVLAMYNVGVFYENGYGVDKNRTTAFTYFKQAAEAGYINAQRVLGYKYRNGIGVERDDRKSAIWFYCASIQGDSIAQCELAKIYEEGKTLYNKYPKKAADYYKKSADGGYDIAQLEIARAYSSGEKYVERNDELAIHYYTLAAHQGNSEARAEIDERYPGKYIVPPKQEHSQPSIMEEFHDEWQQELESILSDLQGVFTRLLFWYFYITFKLSCIIFDILSGTTVDKFLTKKLSNFKKKMQRNVFYRHAYTILYNSISFLPAILTTILMVINLISIIKIIISILL